MCIYVFVFVCVYESLSMGIQVPQQECADQGTTSRVNSLFPLWDLGGIELSHQACARSHLTSPPFGCLLWFCCAVVVLVGGLELIKS